MTTSASFDNSNTEGNMTRNTNDTRHTPGWTAVHEFDDEPTYIVDEYDNEICTINAPYDAERTALIAAAPEMLEALGRLRLEAIHYRDTGVGMEHLNAAIDHAEAVINKAYGETR